MNLKRRVKRLLNSFRSEETVKNRTQTQGELYLFLFLSTMEFSYQFKTQQIPIESGSPAVTNCSHERARENIGKRISFYMSLPSKNVNRTTSFVQGFSKLKSSH